MLYVQEVVARRVERVFQDVNQSPSASDDGKMYQHPRSISKREPTHERGDDKSMVSTKTTTKP